MEGLGDSLVVNGTGHQTKGSPIHCPIRFLVEQKTIVLHNTLIDHGVK